MIGVCAEDPERHLRSEEAATRGEHRDAVGVREEPRRLEVAHGGAVLDACPCARAEAEPEALAGARVGIRGLAAGFGRCARADALEVRTPVAAS